MKKERMNMLLIFALTSVFVALAVLVSLIVCDKEQIITPEITEDINEHIIENECLESDCSNEGIYCEDVESGAEFIYCEKDENGCLKKTFLDYCGDKNCKCKNKNTYSGGYMIQEVIIENKQFYDTLNVLLKEGESFKYEKYEMCRILKIYNINAENFVWASSSCKLI